MDNNIKQLIKNRMDQLAPGVKEAILNPEISKKFTTIANRHSLNLDQNGSLQIKTLLVMLGLEPSADYVQNLQKELEVSKTEAQAIAEDVNRDILQNIRAAIRNTEEKEEREEEVERIQTSAMEKAAQMKVVPPPSSSSPQYNHDKLDREAVLQDLEEIERLQPKKANDFVEHLLSNPVSNSTPVQPKKPVPPVPPRTDGIDPYREQF